MGVSKNSGTPKWMVYFMENPIEMDDLGGFLPLFLVDTHILFNLSGLKHFLHAPDIFLFLFCQKLFPVFFYFF